MHLCLTKQRYLLLEDAYKKVKHDERIDFLCTDINYPLCLCLKKRQMRIFLTPPMSLSSSYHIFSEFS